MKKYFLTMVVMAIFAIGFTASDDSSDSSPEKLEKEYRSSRGLTIDGAKIDGQFSAEANANDLIRQGYAKSDLEKIAKSEAERKYKTVKDCCNFEFFEKEYKELFTESEQERLRQQCIEAYVIGYMGVLGTTKTVYK